MCSCTTSQGMRSNAPIRGGPKDPGTSFADFVKRLDLFSVAIYRQVTLPIDRDRGAVMSSGTREEVMVGEMAIRFLVEGEQTAGSVAVFEFDVPADAKIAAAHSHDGYDETIYGLEGTLTWTVEGEETEVGAAEALLIPRGAVHQFANR